MKKRKINKTIRGIEEEEGVPVHHFEEVLTIAEENPPKDSKEIQNLYKILQNRKEEGDFNKDKVMVAEEDGKTNGGPLPISDEEKKDIEPLNAQIVT